MDKQKGIEEMAKEQRVARLDLFYNFCKYNVCEEKNAEDCVLCYFRNVYDTLAKLEDKIRNGTLKEIDKDSVVLTREEAERFRGQTLNIKKVKAQASKETVEKFVKELEEEAITITRLDGSETEPVVAISFIKYFAAKKFGCEIKE